MDHSKRRDLLQLIGYIVALYVTWSLCRFLLLPYLEHFFTSGIIQGIIEVVVEFVIFVPLSCCTFVPREFHRYGRI